MQEWEPLPLPLSALPIHEKEPGRLQEAEAVANSKPKALGGSSGMVMDLDHAVDACRKQVSQSPYTSCLVSSCCSTRIPLSWETHIESGAQCRYLVFPHVSQIALGVPVKPQHPALITSHITKNG